MLRGDAVIHLIFAENALAGAWFHFNMGEASAGETSPGYMVVVMGLMKLAGQGYAPYAMVALGYGAWLGMLVMWWRLLWSLFAEPWAPWLGVAVMGLMPGSVLNSVLGMENVLLALGVAAVFAWLHRTKALERRLHVRHEMVLALMLGALALLRTEAVCFAGVVLGYRLLVLAPRVGWVREFVHVAAAGVVVLGMFGGMMLAVWMESGVLPFGGGLARLQLAMSEGWMLGVVPVHAKMALRLLAYAPLTAAFMLGCVMLVRQRTAPNRELLGLAAVVVGVFTVLFSSVLPAAHLARYTIFMWPMMVLVGVFGVVQVRAMVSAKVFYALLALAFVGQGAVYGVELYQRKQMAPGHPLASLVHVVEERTQTTDVLLAELGHEGPFPVSVGLVEVQMRYFYDPRVVVRSMDGIVDSLFMNYAHDGMYDYTGYMKARHIDYLMEYIDLNTKADDWSPAMLAPLAPGTVVLHEGVRFDRRAGNVTKVTYVE